MGPACTPVQASMGTWEHKACSPVPLTWRAFPQFLCCLAEFFHMLVALFKSRVFFCAQGQRNLFPAPQYYPSLLPFTVLEVGVPFATMSLSLLLFSCGFLCLWLFSSFSVSPQFFRAVILFIGIIWCVP